MSLRRLSCVLLSLLLGCSTVACAALLGFDDLVSDTVDGSQPVVDAEVDVVVEASVDAHPNQCGVLDLPGAPAVSDAGMTDGSDVPVHLALKSFDFGMDSANAAGFNLDRTCSTSLATSSCAIKESEGEFEKYSRDRDDGRGIDSASSGLLAQLGQYSDPFLPAAINQRLLNGEYGFVVRVDDWNHTAEDSNVTVELFPTVGVALDPQSSDREPGGKPKFTANDVWLRDMRFQKVSTIDRSSQISANAYVTGSRLVATFDHLTFPIYVPHDEKPLDVILQEAYVVGNLIADGSGYRLSEGTIAGRWRTADLLAEVRQVYIADTVGLRDVYLCDPGQPASYYQSIKKEVCLGRDLRETRSEDNRGLPCNAVSSAIRFDSYALDDPGPFYARQPIANRCEKDGSIPEGDDCPPAVP